MQNVQLENVSSVYSGINGRCCCGCSGKHTYAAQHVEWASDNRGYPVTPDEVNDRTVKLVVNKINAANAVATFPGLVSIVIGRRIYIAYLKN